MAVVDVTVIFIGFEHSSTILALHFADHVHLFYLVVFLFVLAESALV
jgi:hypothetical protein